MRIRCGTCKGAHSSVEEVRACGRSTLAGRPASVKARSLAQALARENVALARYEAMERDAYEAMITAMTGSQISVFIREMLKQPKVLAITWDDWKHVKAGKYALRDGEGTVKFYQVSKVISPGKPRIIYLLIGAPGDFRMQRIYRADGIMARIAEDPLEAFALFGKEVGQCGVCSSPLTQKHTRERGVGDICWAKIQG